MLAVPLGVVLVVVLVAAGTDLWRFRIHNALTVPLFLSGLMYHAFVGQAIGVSGSVLGVLVGTLPFFVLYAKGGMGAGDLKLMAGVGAWLGPWFTLHVLIVSGLATGCYSAALMSRNRVRSATGQHGNLAHRIVLSEEATPKRATDVAVILDRPDRRSNAVPFGAMVALGVIVTALWIV